MCIIITFSCGNLPITEVSRWQPSGRTGCKAPRAPPAPHRQESFENRRRWATSRTVPHADGRASDGRAGDGAFRGRAAANPPLSDRRHRLLGRRAGGLAGVLLAHAAGFPHGLRGHHPPAAGPREHVVLAAGQVYEDAGRRCRRRHARPAQPRLRGAARAADNSRWRFAQLARRAGPLAAPADRLFLSLPGRRSAGARDLRHSFRHGGGRHAGPAGGEGRTGHGDGPGAALGQVRRHAVQRRGDRPGGLRPARRGHAATVDDLRPRALSAAASADRGSGLSPRAAAADPGLAAPAAATTSLPTRKAPSAAASSGG